jgi:hypothetical protein
MILICRTPNKEERLAGGTQSAQAKACGYQRLFLLPVTADLRLAGDKGGIMARTRKNGRHNGKDHISQEAVQSLVRSIGDIRRHANCGRAIGFPEN